MSIQETLLRKCPGFIKKLIIPSWIEVRQFLEGAANEISSNSMVLDAGAGQCQYKELFHRHQYYAIDAAIGDTGWNYSGLDVIGDLGEMPIKSNTFDAIICTQVLEHVCEPQKIINEAYRILKPDGILYLSAPQGWGVHQAPHDYFRFTCYGLLFLFKNSGFQIITIKPSCGYFGYLSNRLSMLPKFVFWGIKNPLLRIVLFPFEIISYFLFVLLFPLILNSMDFLDKQRDFTLNYFAKVQKAE